MTLTRRDLLTAGIPAAAALGLAAGAELKAGPTNDANLQNIGKCCPTAEPIGAFGSEQQQLQQQLAPIPTADQLFEWEVRYKARYKAAHRAQGEAFARIATDDVPADRIDRVAARLEAEVEAAEALVAEDDVDAVAAARGQGFAARRDGIAATANPYFSNPNPYEAVLATDKYMGWYAGWVQGGDQSHVYGPRGYTPPAPYVCPLCDAPAGEYHRGPIKGRIAPLVVDGRASFSYEACEDHVLVTRPPPRQRPGTVFT